MICIHCDRAILPGESYNTHHHDAPSTGGCTNHSHKGGCPSRATGRPAALRKKQPQ